MICYCDYGVEKGTVYQRSGSTQLLYQGATAKDISTSSAQGELHIGTLFCSVSMLSIVKLCPRTLERPV